MEDSVLQAFMCELRAVRTALESAHGRDYLEPIDRNRLADVKTGELQAGETSGVFVMPDELQGNDARRCSVANLGDNPMSARFKGSGGSFVSIPIMPRERFEVPFSFQEVEFVAEKIGPTSYRMVAQ